MPKWKFIDETDEFVGDSLYFIQESGGGSIKIGRGDPKRRIKELQTGNPRKLTILTELKNEGYAEAFWHVAFGDFKIRGEWFEPSPNLLSAIRWAGKGDHWADEAPADDEFDLGYFKERMLDAWDEYCDRVFSGKSEVKSAKATVNWAYGQALEELWGRSLPTPHPQQEND